MTDIRLAARRGAEKTVVPVDGVRFGSGFSLIAGPCTVETEKQTVETAVAVRRAGAHALRGGAFKPRSSPYAFQGLGLEGLKILRKAKAETGLPIVTEVIDARDVPWVVEYADVLQIGTRNMQNYPLLREAGKAGKPVLLKRGMNSTLDEWLKCAEYVLSEGNPHVILCERGIRTFETYTRNTLDLSAVPALRELTHLPVIVDPSHAAGKASLVPPLCLAAAAAGADGLIVEVQVNPQEAVCDRSQTLSPDEFAEVARQAGALHGLLHPPAAETREEV